MLRRTAYWLAGICLSCALAVSGLDAQAREPGATISSDRPGIGNGAYVLANQELQLEGGLGYARANGVDQYAVGQLLLRYGLPFVELRVGLNSFVWNDSDASGFEDLSLGAKVRLGEGDGGRVAALFGTTLPTGADAFTADEVVIGGGLLADWAASGPFAVSFNLVVSTGLESDSEALTAIVTPAIGLTESLGLYGGWAGIFSEGTDSHFAEAGLTYLVNEDTQLDLNGGYEVESEAFFLGIGIARRARP